MQLSEWILVITTLFLGWIAIWGEQIKYRLGFRPKLEIKLNNQMGELIIPKHPDTNKLRYYHLKIFNANPRFPATNVRVVISEIARPKADGKYEFSSLAGPLQLNWRFSKYHPQYPTVGAEVISDLGSISKDGFGFSTVVPPEDFLGKVEANKSVIVEIRALADNAESEPIYLNISWDGNWSDDTLTMARHLVIKEEALSR